MKRIFTAVLFLTTASLCFGQGKTAWNGFVTDTHCGTNCQRTSDMKPDAACVRRCVRRGSKYGLWYGNHVYELEPQAKVRKFAAKVVHVTGDLENDVIHVQSIRPISQSGTALP